MTRRALVTLFGVLLAVTSTSAQSKPAASDPVSGTWSGHLGAGGGADGQPVTLKLKFDGKRAVTGTIDGFSNPGNVKTGSFDPKTGALKLELGKVDDSAVLITLEGAVAKGEVAGKVAGEINGKFVLKKQK
jgi:hypothetical protein